MPAIRDFSFAYESVTTDAGITIPMCNYQEGDLLLVFAMSDTIGSQTDMAASGYAKLFWRSNTCTLWCGWKIATASEGDVVVTSVGTNNETYNGCVIAIRDVDQTNPFGNPSVFNDTTQASAARFAMQQITTNRDNSLVIYVSANSAAGVPSFIEGIAHGLVGADGAAESMGVGWMFKKTSGLTPSDIFCSNVSAGAGVKAAIQICPPVGGAAVIPAYTAAEASALLEYINGTTAYNGNTAIAATADTNFGTTLGGRTANDATLAASADVGINSFHSFARLTNAAVAGTVSGAELVFSVANRPNVGTKNILTHLRPQSPGNYQRLSTVASGRGVWFGIRSAAANYKIWQVHGVGTSWPLDAKIPVVINSAAANTKASAGTLDTAAVQALGFWVGGLGALQAGIEFGVAWLMDTTTLCGGNSSFPINIEGIVDSASLAHERLSCLQQGSRQMLCLQAIQFGNGGTDPVFLDLDATAIEFPQQYDAAAGAVNYNSTDNVVGFTYYAGASDTIKHRNSVISSASKYHWRIHASSSASATYDFSGLSIIGAGDVVLRAVTTFSAMVFNTCALVTQNSAVISDCTFRSAPLLSNNPANISGCTFISGGSGHAIQITTPGTYSFSGNQFSGFGADGTTNAAIYNNSGGAVTLNITGGGTPTVRNGAGASTSLVSSVSVTLTGLKNPSEVRVFEAGTTTEVAGSGAESVTSGSHVFSVGSGVAVDIAILALGYQNLRILNYSTTSNASVPVSQVLDRQYANP